MVLLPPQHLSPVVWDVSLFQTACFALVVRYVALLPPGCH